VQILSIDPKADKAISGLNGKDLKGRPLTVSEARPRTGGGSKEPSALFYFRGNSSGDMYASYVSPSQILDSRPPARPVPTGD